MKTYELDYVGTVEEAHAYAVALTVVFGVKIDRVEREWANGNPCVFIVDDDEGRESDSVAFRVHLLSRANFTLGDFEKLDAIADVAFLEA